MHIDFETTGLSPIWDDWVGIGIACSSQPPLYIARSSLDTDGKTVLREWLRSKELYAFNAVFDLAFMAAWFADGDHKVAHKHMPTVGGCSLTLWRQLSNEGYKGQRWNLETAIEEILGWPDHQKTWLTSALEKHRLKKADMYQLAELEAEEFGFYCALDAEASLQLHDYCIWEAENAPWGEELLSQYEAWKVVAALLIEQEMFGLSITREKLATYRQQLVKRMRAAEGALRKRKDIGAFIREWEAKAASQLTVIAKKVYVQTREDLDDECTFEKSGSTKLKDWEKEEGGRYFRVLPCIRQSKTRVSFNFSSPQQLRWLLYEKVCPTGYIDKDERGMLSFMLPINGRVVPLDLTKSGQKLARQFGQELNDHTRTALLEYTPTGKGILPLFGRLGELLREYGKAEKTLGYIDKCLELSERDGRVHVKFRTHGTATGRCAASGGFNLSQQTKEWGYLECMVPDPGHVFVQMDIAALEKVVQAEFSKDPLMMELYASGKTHDIYLFDSQFYHPDKAFRETIKSEYSATPEAINKLKKKYKAQRSAIKDKVLGMDYGMGPRKLWRQAMLIGQELTPDECFEIWKGKREAYKGVYIWERDLLAERDDRGGYILDGFGAPACVPDGYTKDILNRFVQRTGHTFLLKLIVRINELRIERGLVEVMRPIIVDYHDETIWQAPIDRAEEVKAVIEDALKDINDELQPIIRFSGDVQFAYSLAEIKCEADTKTPEDEWLADLFDEEEDDVA